MLDQRNHYGFPKWLILSDSEKVIGPRKSYYEKKIMNHWPLSYLLLSSHSGMNMLIFKIETCYLTAPMWLVLWKNKLLLNIYFPKVRGQMLMRFGECLSLHVVNGLSICCLSLIARAHSGGLN